MHRPVLFMTALGSWRLQVVIVRLMFVVELLQLHHDKTVEESANSSFMNHSVVVLSPKLSVELRKHD